MTLNEKFEEAFNDWTPSHKCEEIADQHAIEFALWCDENVYEGDSYIKALEQFKKEKGL